MNKWLKHVLIHTKELILKMIFIYMKYVDKVK